jgi:hypothetical protein
MALFVVLLQGGGLMATADRQQTGRTGTRSWRPLILAGVVIAVVAAVVLLVVYGGGGGGGGY